MKRLLVRNSITGARLATLLLLSPVVVAQQSCTDLTESPPSAITPENYFKNEAEVLAALAAVYAQLRSTLDGYWNLSEVSADEMIVPTRGTDWDDNGKWRELDAQGWGPNSTIAGDINGAWVSAFTGVVRANALLAAMANVTVADKEKVQAEVRTLRAYYYFQLMDMFGGVPLVEDVELKARPRNTRAEIFAFVEKELNEARVALPVKWDPGNHGRITRGAADAILASLYLNAGVFSKDAGVSATSYNSCQPVQISGASACQKAIEAADRVLNSGGGYTLSSNFASWRSNFTADNDNSPENIFVIKFHAATDLGLNFLMRTLHYSQLNAPTPWNGFATIAEVYNAFDQDDQRRSVMLVGPQINFDTGEPAFERGGRRLDFTAEIANPRSATESEGARNYKWPADPGHVEQNHGNDFAIFRLGEIYLIKAEALNELGQTAAAIALVNQVRARVFATPEPLGPMSQAAFRDAILRERLFELTFELKRRQDLIRHGKFTAAWQFKAATAAHKILMPIPQAQLDANQLLTQNPGY